MKKFYKYNDSTHESTVTFVDKGIKTIGKAKAHEDDLRFANKIVGLQIAEFRALSKFLEKRASRKMKKIQSLRNDADFLEQSANDDLLEASEIKEIMQGYINGKSAFYEKIKNPPPRVKWNKLPEEMLSEDFKKQFKEIDTIG